MKRTIAERAAEKALLPLKLSFYPRRCISCGRSIKEADRLCPLCDSLLSRVNFEKRCQVCGQEKKYCICEFKAYYFLKTVAPFYNEGIAKKIMYSYKLGLKRAYAEYFAKAMANAVKAEYKDKSFTALTFVPTAHRAVSSRGFDQAMLLARIISKELSVPFASFIARRVGASGQHGLNRAERELAVKNLYHCKCSVPHGRILLVDDIMTTGSTLSACARELLRAGADEVYCVTGLIGNGKRFFKDKKEKQTEIK